MPWRDSTPSPGPTRSAWQAAARRQPAGLRRAAGLAAPSRHGAGTDGGADRRSCRMVGGAARDSGKCLRRLRRPAADDDGPRADAGSDPRLAGARQRRPAADDRGGGAIRLGHRSRRADCRRRRRRAAGREDHFAGVGGHRAHRHRRARPSTQASRRCAARGPFPGTTGQARCAAHSQPGARRNAARMAAECSDRRQARSCAVAARSASSDPRDRRPHGSGRTDP